LGRYSDVADVFAESLCQDRLVCPIYDMLHVLQLSLYTPLLLQSGIFSGFFDLVLFCNVFALLRAMFMFVCLCFCDESGW